MHLAFDQLDRGEQERGESAADGAAEDESAKRKFFRDEIRIEVFTDEGLSNVILLMLAYRRGLRVRNVRAHTLKNSAEFSAAAPTSGGEIPRYSPRIPSWFTVCLKQSSGPR